MRHLTTSPTYATVAINILILSSVSRPFANHLQNHPKSLAKWIGEWRNHSQKLQDHLTATVLIIVNHKYSAISKNPTPYRVRSLTLLFIAYVFKLESPLPPSACSSTAICIFVERQSISFVQRSPSIPLSSPFTLAIKQLTTLVTQPTNLTSLRKGFSTS